ncbi:unnamed protein product, partial [Choristocarpus tenellus]
MAKARGNSPGLVVPVDDAKYHRFVAGVPRQYDVFVLFTAEDPAYKCPTCKAFGEEFRVLAESYDAAQRNQPENLKGVDIFFVMADFASNKGVFQRLGLQSVPKLIHFPAYLTEPEGG